MPISHVRSPELYEGITPVDASSPVDGIVAVTSEILGISQTFYFTGHDTGTTVRFMGSGYPTIIYAINASNSQDLILQCGETGATDTLTSFTARAYFIYPLGDGGFLFPIN